MVGSETAYGRFAKPALDRVGAAVLLGVTAPVQLAVLAGVRIALGRPVLLGQERVGKDGKTFTMYKVRTMRPDRRTGAERRAVAMRRAAVMRRAERARVPRKDSDRRVTHKTINDPRHTGIGRLLRRTSLDELPQLWNVLRGDMSLIGPRPELASVADRDGLRPHPRHRVRPGLTGLWQISASRQRHIRDGLELDVAYVDEVTFRADVRIALATVRAIVRNPGS